jgi:hypothetical protein
MTVRLCLLDCPFILHDASTDNCCQQFSICQYKSEDRQVLKLSALGVALSRHGLAPEPRGYLPRVVGKTRPLDRQIARVNNDCKGVLFLRNALYNFSEQSRYFSCGRDGCRGKSQRRGVWLNGDLSRELKFRLD